MKVASILSFFDKEEIPKGKIYSSNNVMVIFHDEDPLMTYYTQNVKNTITLESLGIDMSICKIISVDMFNEGRLFMLVSKKSIPVAYFISINNDDSTHLPKTIQLCCSSVSFHKKILSVFIPQSNIFCIISREGISIHTITLQTIYSKMIQIRKCVYLSNYIMYASNKGVSLIRINEDGTISEFLKSGTTQLFIPFTLLIHSRFLTLVQYDTNNNIVFQRISHDGNLLPSVSIRNFFNNGQNPDQYNYQMFDDAVLVSDDKFNAVYLDISTSKVVFLSKQFQLEENLQKIIFYKFGYSQTHKFKVHINFDSITDIDPDLIGAVFRRHKSLSRALTLFSQSLQQTKTVDGMKQLINATAPYAVDSVAQVRYVRAIQFASVAEPHLILLALINTVNNMGEKMIDAAKNTIFELLAHIECIFTMKTLIAIWGLKLNEYALQIIAPKLGEEIDINPEYVQDILVYADICIESDKPNIAKRLILRFVIDEEKSSRDINQIRLKYKEKFGEDPLSPSY